MMIKEIYLATRNEGKMAEFSSILMDVVKVRSVYELIDRHLMVVEDGKTLEENAAIKAAVFSKLVKGLVVADDSGIFVDILNGRPGIYSARYAGENASDVENIEKLLSELEGIPLDKRQATFRCVIAVALNGELVNTFTGEVHGFIGHEMRGEDGFGYDPIFYIDKEKSFAEIGAQEKNKISHRAKAIEKLRHFLKDYVIE
jgi:XTP/dITP diphosphohydrolase